MKKKFMIYSKNYSKIRVKRDFSLNPDNLMFPSSKLLLMFHLFLRILCLFLPQEILARDF